MRRAYRPAYLTWNKEGKSLQRGFDKILEEIDGACLLACGFPWLSVWKLQKRLYHSKTEQHRRIEVSRVKACCTLATYMDRRY